MSPDRDPVLAEILRRIVAVADPERIVLFGSRARGAAGAESDYDLLIVKRDVPHRRTLAREIYRNLRGVTVGVDIIVETPEHLADVADMPGAIYADALRDGMVVYGA